MTKETAILLWLPVGTVPQAPAFEAVGVTTCASLSEALVIARKEIDERSGQPWISTSGAMFGPDHIRVMLETLMDSDG